MLDRIGMDEEIPTYENKGNALPVFLCPLHCSCVEPTWSRFSSQIQVWPCSVRSLDWSQCPGCWRRPELAGFQRDGEGWKTMVRTRTYK